MNVAVNPDTYERLWSCLTTDFEALIQEYLNAEDWSYRKFAELAQARSITAIFHWVGTSQGRLENTRRRHYEAVIKLILKTAKEAWLIRDDPPPPVSDPIDKTIFDNFWYLSMEEDDIDLFEEPELIRLKRQVGGFFLLWTLHQNQPTTEADRFPIEIGLDDQEMITKFQAKMKDLKIARSISGGINARAERGVKLQKQVRVILGVLNFQKAFELHEKFAKYNEAGLNPPNLNLANAEEIRYKDPDVDLVSDLKEFDDLLYGDRQREEFQVLSSFAKKVEVPENVKSALGDLASDTSEESLGAYGGNAYLPMPSTSKTHGRVSYKEQPIAASSNPVSETWRKMTMDEKIDFAKSVKVNLARAVQTKESISRLLAGYEGLKQIKPPECLVSVTSKEQTEERLRKKMHNQPRKSRAKPSELKTLSENTENYERLLEMTKIAKTEKIRARLLEEFKKELAKRNDNVVTDVSQLLRSPLDKYLNVELFEDDTSETDIPQENTGETPCSSGVHSVELIDISEEQISENAMSPLIRSGKKPCSPGMDSVEEVDISEELPEIVKDSEMHSGEKSCNPEMLPVEVMDISEEQLPERVMDSLMCSGEKQCNSGTLPVEVMDIFDEPKNVFDSLLNSGRRSAASACSSFSLGSLDDFLENL